MNAVKKPARSRLYLSTARKLASLAERITGRDWAIDSAISVEAKPLRLVCDILDAAYAGRTLRDIEESFDIELTPRLAAVATKEAILGAAQRQVEQAQRAAFVAANEAPDVAATYLRAQAAVLPRDLLDSVDPSPRGVRAGGAPARARRDPRPCALPPRGSLPSG